MNILFFFVVVSFWYSGVGWSELGPFKTYEECKDNRVMYPGNESGDDVSLCYEKESSQLNDPTTG